MRNIDDFRPNSTFEEWSEFLSAYRTIDLFPLYIMAIEERAERLGSINYHAATADRLLGAATIDITMTDKERLVLGEAAEKVIALANAIFAEHPEVIARFNDAISYSREYYAKLLTKLDSAFGAKEYATKTP